MFLTLLLSFALATKITIKQDGKQLSSFNLKDSHVSFNSTSLLDFYFNNRSISSFRPAPYLFRLQVSLDLGDYPFHVSGVSCNEFQSKIIITITKPSKIPRPMLQVLPELNSDGALPVADNRSFLQKYWMYILMAIYFLINMMNEPEPGAQETPAAVPEK